MRIVRMSGGYLGLRRNGNSFLRLSHSEIYSFEAGLVSFLDEK
jgi:hypothetical protein